MAAPSAPALSNYSTDVVEPSPSQLGRGATGIPDGAILATVNQTMAALGLGRTKVNDLMNVRTLVRVKVGGRTMITVESIRALLPSKG